MTATATKSKSKKTEAPSGIVVKCDRAIFAANLALTGRAVPLRPSHAVLANILLIADQASQSVTLRAFDLSLGIQTEFAAEVEASVAIALPAALLSDIVTRSPDGLITLTIDQLQVKLKTPSGSYELRGTESQEFPELPEIEAGDEINLPASILVEGLRSTLFAVSSDESKQVLTGCRLTGLTDGFEIASTDAHRLSVWRSPWEEEREAAIDLAVTVPGKALQELVKALERSSDVSVSYDQSQIIFKLAAFKLTSRLLEGQYPNYRQLIPKAFERQVATERKLLLSALERIAILAEQKSDTVTITLDSAEQRLTLSVDAQDVGSGKETIPAQITGDDLEIAFNVKYLMDGLKAIATTEIHMQLNTAASPAIVTPLGGIDSTYLLMPMQIRGKADAG